MKKGEMSISLIIGIIIGIFVLTITIYGFTTNWKMFNSQVCIFTNCNSNVEAVGNACELACIQGNKKDYCETTRTLKLGDGEPQIKGTCLTIRKEVTEKKIQNVNIVSCDTLCK